MWPLVVINNLLDLNERQRFLMWKRSRTGVCKRNRRPLQQNENTVLVQLGSWRESSLGQRRSDLSLWIILPQAELSSAGSEWSFHSPTYSEAMLGKACAALGMMETSAARPVPGDPNAPAGFHSSPYNAHPVQQLRGLKWKPAGW